MGGGEGRKPMPESSSLPPKPPLPAFFFFLLARCFEKDRPFLHLVKLGVAVIGSFGVLWAPFCLVPASDGEACTQGLLHGEMGAPST
jgi:hypothetical protein